MKNLIYQQFKGFKTNSAIIFTIALLFVLYANLSFAQLSQYLINQDENQTLYDIKAGMQPYMDSLETTQDSATFYAEGGEYIEYMKFMDYWEPRLFPHGNFSKSFDADSAYYANTENNYPYFSDKPWHEVGPFERPGGTGDGIGPVEYLSIFDTGTVESTQYMLSASLLGGVFYSTDFGESWSSTSTDTQWGQSGSGCAIFHPTDNKTWFASSSGNSNSGYSLWIGKTGGIWRTTNEGANWELIADRQDLGGVWTKIFKLHVLPNNPDVLFAVTSNGIYKSTNCDSTDPQWIKVLEGLAYDIESKPGNTSTLYATAFMKTTVDTAWKVMKSNSNGDLGTWLEMSPQPQLVESSEIKHSSFTIEVSKAKPDYLYCLVNQNYNANLYYYDFGNTGSWNKVNTTPYYMNFGMGHGFGVEQIINGETVITSYGTRKKIFDINVPSAGIIKGQHHADVEDILFHPYNPDEVWLCSHGGVEKSENGGLNWQTKYTGLSVANVEEMATSVTNPELVMIGLYHDHTQLTESSYSENWVPDWKEAYNIGDGMRPLIDPIDPNKMWASYQEGNWRYTENQFDTYKSRVLSSGFFTEGVLNKVTPSKMYRQAKETSSNDFAEVFFTETIDLTTYSNNLISSFYPTHTDGYVVRGLYTPYTSGDHLLVTIRDTANDQSYLYRTTNVNDPPQSVLWEELTLPQNDSWIATIDFDPEEENTVYVVYSSSLNDDNFPYANKMVYRINYEVPDRPVFMNLTKDLPYTTTGKDCIEIDNGGTRGIYLYTEYGIFYTNNDLLYGDTDDSWQKFGTELPHTRSGSLEINYECNKLRAGLYGRGVWEIPLPCITDRGDLTLTTNETWTEDTRIGGIVTIEQNVELNILNTTISFGDDAKIIVKPGAKLIIDGATLTNACSEMWPGIEVWGNSNAHQYPDANGNFQQGYVELRNGAVIENAWEAIQPWKPDDFQKTGGIIVANGATFKNNRRAVQFISYQNFDPQTGDPKPNQCVFKNCTFETNEDFDELFGVSPFSTFGTVN